jgi:hypothetical protein
MALPLLVAAELTALHALNAQHSTPYPACLPVTLATSPIQPQQAHEYYAVDDGSPESYLVYVHEVGKEPKPQFIIDAVNTNAACAPAAQVQPRRDRSRLRSAALADLLNRAN